MKRTRQRYGIDRFRGDLFGGLTSAVVALPLTLAFGVASGLGAAAGLYGAVGLGFFAAAFGGTSCQISRPSAPMTVAVATIIVTHASTITEVFTVVVLGGILQALFGLLRVGQFVAYTPFVVISGFMSGVGFIIILIQVLPFLGVTSAPGSPVGVLLALPDAVANVNPSALALGAISLGVAVFWPTKLAKYVPGLLVALLVGTGCSILWFTDVAVIGQVPSGLPGLQVEMPSPGFVLGAFQPALMLALVGSINSLLTSLVADSVSGTRHNPNRELFGQGVGNIVTGMFGGLPGAGATMGTITNIRAGGTTRVSGIITALIMLALLLGLGRYVEPIPHAVLAGILIKVGWDIVDWPLLTRIHRIQREHLVIMLATFGLTVFVDLVTAVFIGLVASAMLRTGRLENLESAKVVSVPARVGLVRITGRLTVASAHRLYTVVGESLRDRRVVVLDFTEVLRMDDAAAMAINRLISIVTGEGAECIVVGLSGPAAETMRTLDILRGLPSSHVVETMNDAREITGAQGH